MRDLLEGALVGLLTTGGAMAAISAPYAGSGLLALVGVFALSAGLLLVADRCSRR